MATNRNQKSNTDRTMSVQEAGRRGGHRVQELVQKGEELENREGTGFGERMPQRSHTKSEPTRNRDDYDQAA